MAAIVPSFSKLLNIQIEEDPNNNSNYSSGQSSNLYRDSNLLTINKASVIVKHQALQSLPLSNEDNNIIHRPIPTDQDSFFSNNPTVLLGSSRINHFNSMEHDYIHPRIAFRRISAPANLLSGQLSAFSMKTTNASDLDSPSLSHLLLRQKLSLQDTTKIDGLNERVFDISEKKLNSKRRNSEPFNMRPRNREGQIHFLWEFLIHLLNDEKYSKFICWLSREKGIFKLLDSREVSNLWGMFKGKRNMKYETMARALRYYYQKQLLRKINGRLVYQFINIDHAN